MAQYAAPGFLVFQNGLALMGQRFSAASHKVNGAPFPLRDDSEGARTNSSGALGDGAPACLLTSAGGADASRSTLRRVSLARSWRDVVGSRRSTE